MQSQAALDQLKGRKKPSGCFRFSLAAGILFLTWLIYSYFIEPGWVQIKTLEVPVSGLAQNMDGYRIAQVSDIHMTHWMNEQRLDRIVDQVNGLKPDIIALTGDFVYENPDPYLAGLSRALARLAPRDQVLAIMGNHDHWSEVEKVRTAISAAGITELRNSSHALRIANKVSLYIAGVDDPSEGKDRIDLAMAGMTEPVPAILLAHEPDFADSYSTTGRFFLQLSGHSHGGQVRLPLIGAIFLPPFAHKYSDGKYQVNNMLVYTNPGVGAIPVHIRFNCRPEITLFVLRSVK